MLSTKPRAGLAVLVVLIFGACRQQPAGPARRFAVLRFENLTGDASLDWAGRAVSEDLTRRLAGSSNAGVVGTTTLTRVNAGFGGRPGSAPGVSGERTAALGASANHAITGYISRSGDGLRLVASDEDLSTHQIVRSVSATGKTLLEAIGAAAQELAAKPRAGLTASEVALRSYAEGLEKPLQQQAPVFETAVAQDPGFGVAWTSLVRVKAGEARASGIDAADRGLGQKLDPIDTAALEVEKAELQGNRKERIAALRKYVALNPGDVLLLRSLAEQESIAGEFATSAADWRRIAVILPGDFGALNQAGYNFAWAGNYAEAVRAIKEYQVLAPRDANPLDSLGDVNYWFGRYSEAASNYSAAHTTDPKISNGGDLYKAAWARLRAGDQKAADTLLEQFVKLRQAARDPSLPVLQADWLYQTGRRKEAQELLRKEGALSKDPSQKLLIFAELGIWDLVEGKREAALADLQQTGPVATPATLTARFAAQPPASEAEWEARANVWFARPQLAPLRDSGLGWALILDGKKEAARKVWEKIAADRPATDFFTRDVLTRLKGEPLRNSSAPDPRDVNQFAAVLAKI